MKKYIQKIREKYSVFLILILLVTSFSFGYLIKKSPVTEKAVEHSSDAHKGHSAMKHMRHITLSDTAQKLASIQVMPVERKFVTAEISMFGKIDYDETKLAYITARVPGRLDRLYVDYTGISVRKGDHLVYLYSPELLTAQEELIQALKRVRTKNNDRKYVQKDSFSILEAVREKLRLWGLTESQIKQIEKKNKPSDHITIYAPISGTVIHKNAMEGMYVNTGTQIYTIADLNRVWVKLEAYESDITWIRYGQKVEIRTETYPGERFEGRISFIDPILNQKTRTVAVRVNVENRDGRLKPGMFVRGIVYSRMSAGGKVVEPDLAGKWISPMHPEIIKNRPGKCDICGMPLVQAEMLGYAAAEPKNAPIVIPATVPLITGKRAVVYVRIPDNSTMFEGREVVLGPRAGNYYIVLKGLHEGELVVVNGNFKIDSAMQIEAKPSMMNPEGGGMGAVHKH
ncbi:MAG: efflux RND transporter periplasmic adaptor subunit [Desulfobacterales bacterium]|nr:efflux RND transporter periplasmic adaptor subunit [Desulfobacterales bacterium]